MYARFWMRRMPTFSVMTRSTSPQSSPDAGAAGARSSCEARMSASASQ
jgi:hypothetical protein